jgi:1-deoxy-D-xylulose-5-phosphate reductoisomerase
MPDPQRLAILGSTGSIGRSTLEVVAEANGSLLAAALSTHRRWTEASHQARQFAPRWLICADPHARDAACLGDLPASTEVLYGPESLEQIARSPEVDTVVAAIVGIAGLRSTWAAVESGKRVALANKETLVVAGPLVTELAARRGAELLPVDSEHSAIFQALAAGRRHELRRVILTASGGPFRDFTASQLADVTVDQALEHPTWDMGPKITIDSATMMNKALEIIEARWLFDLQPDQIHVVIHPQSIVHSMVEFVDGSVIAQLSPPDMKLPIQYALTYPHRIPGPALSMDWSVAHQLQFFPPDPVRFPAIELGLEVARRGGTAGVVTNGANEAAVESFMAGRLRFQEIVPVCRTVLEHHNFDPNPSLEELFRLDRWARQEVSRWIHS